MGIFSFFSKKKTPAEEKKEAKEKVSVAEIKKQDKQKAKDKAEGKARPSSQPVGVTRPRSNATTSKDAPSISAASSQTKWAAAKKPAAKDEKAPRLKMGRKRTPDELLGDVASGYSEMIKNGEEVIKSDHKHSYEKKLNDTKETLDELDDLYDVPKEGSQGNAVSHLPSYTVMAKSYSMHARDELANAQASMEKVLNVKSLFREDVKRNPKILEMIKNVQKVNSEAKAKAEGIAQAEIDGEKNSLKQKVLEQNKDKRVWEIMNDSEHGKAIGTVSEDPSTGEKVVDKMKSWGEALLDLYNNVMGNIGDTKDAIEVIKNGKDYAANVEDFTDDSWKKIKFEKPGVVDGVLSGLSALGAYVSLLVNVVKVLKGFQETSENVSSADGQEKLGMVKDNIFNIMDSISSFIDFSSLITGNIPFLGPTLALTQNIMSIGKASVEVHDARKHRKESNEALTKLKARMKEKHDKYAKDPDSQEFFRLDSMDDKAIRDKKNALMRDAMETVGGTKRSTKANDIHGDGHGDKWHWRSWIDTRFHKKDREVWDKGYGDVTDRMQDKMEQMRSEYHGMKQEPESDAKEKKIRDYKKKMHRLEAIQLLSDYEIQRAAKHRNKVKLRGAGTELGIAIAKTLANATELGGEILTATGGAAPLGGGAVGVAKTSKAAIGIAETGIFIGGKLNGHFEKHSQRGLNKKFHRNEMAIALCERMAAFGDNYFGSSKKGIAQNSYSDLVENGNVSDKIEDRQIIHMQREFDFIRGVRQSTDMKVSSIIKAKNRAEVIDSLSNVFSQDGN